MSGFPAWLQLQGKQLEETVGAVASNQLQPARDTVIYTLVIIGLIWAAIKITKLIKK
jgi:hypothetical protein